MSIHEQASHHNGISKPEFATSPRAREVVTAVVNIPFKPIRVATDRFRNYEFYSEVDEQDSRETVQAYAIPSVYKSTTKKGKLVLEPADRLFLYSPKSEVSSVAVDDLAKDMVKDCDDFTEFQDTAAFVLAQPFREYYERAASDDAVKYRTEAGHDVSFPNRENSASITHRVASKMSGMHGTIARKGVELLTREGVTGDEPQQLVDWLSTIDEKDYTPIVRWVETVLRRGITEGDDYQVDSLMFFVEALHNNKLLRKAHERDSILGFPDLAVKNRDIAALLQADLADTSTEVKRSGEQTYLMLSKKLMALLLARYECEPKRHTENTKAAKNYIFPDPKRPDTLRRDHLVELANYANSTSKPDATPYKTSDAGVVGNAFYDVLAITRSTDKKVIEEQELEDALYANIIGMMLEQRTIAKVAINALR